PDDEFEHRRKRYAIMMAGRALCVIAAALTYRVSPWLAVAFVLGGAILPWSAVVLANDRPPKKRARIFRRFIAPHLPALPGKTGLPRDADEEPTDTGEWHNRARDEHPDSGEAEDLGFRHR